MKKVLLSLFLFGMMPVCFADAGEVNEREFICAKIGRIGSTTVEARLNGYPLDALLARAEQRFEIENSGVLNDTQVAFERELKVFVKEVYEGTEDKTPLAAYATQYTRCLTHEIFIGVHVFLKN